MNVILKNYIEKDMWFEFSRYQYLDKEYISLYENHLVWELISTYQILDYDLIYLYQDKLNFHVMSYYQNLDEQTMIEFQDRLNWSNIALIQKMSLDFIKGNIQRLPYEYLRHNRKLNQNIVREIYEQYKDLI